jgi:hypothetical protein
MKRGSSGIGVLFLLIVGCLLIAGWVLNIVKLISTCDFKAPYRAEVLRTVGIFVMPMGVIEGYLSIGDK